MFREYVKKIPKNMITAIALLIVIVIGYLDYITGFEIELTIFYLLPVLLVSWIGGKMHAVVISVFSAIIWLIADIEAGHPFSHPLIPVWNTFMLLGYFMIFVFASSKIKTLLEKEQLSSRIDFLTGALNSRAFYENLQIEITRADRHRHPISLAYIDVDNFKQVNDTYGHGVGDSVLRSVSATMQQHVRSSDIVSPGVPG